MTADYYVGSSPYQCYATQVIYVIIHLIAIGFRECVDKIKNAKDFNNNACL